MVSAIAVSTDRQAAITRGWLGPLLVGLGVYTVCIVYSPALLNDGDTLSHIVIGRWILEHGALPFNDPFSYTARDQTWVPHEWLAEVVFAILYGGLGWGGIIAGTALAAGAAFGLLTGALQTSLGPRRATIAAVLAMLLAEGHLLARPHVLAWPLLIIWMAGIVQARDRGRVPSLALLPVMVLWCNLHGGFVVGLAFAGLLGAEAVIAAPRSDRVRLIARWGAFVALATTSTLLSPNGWHLLTLPLEMLRMSFATSSISEWHGVDFTHLQLIEIWIVLAALGGFASALRLPLTRIAMLLLLLHQALTHVRNEELLGFIGLLLVAGPLAEQFGNPISSKPAPVMRRGGRQPPMAAAACALAAVAAGFGFWTTASILNTHGLRPPEAVAPVAAVQAARAAGLTGHVFNSIRFGGYLMAEGIPTFVDGRADLFGDAFLARYAAATAGADNGLPYLLDYYSVAWVLFEPQSPTATVVAHLPGWERIYADPYATVFRRTSGEQRPGGSPAAHERK